MLLALLLLGCPKAPPFEPQVQTGGEPVPALQPAPEGAMTESPFSPGELRAGFVVGTKIVLSIKTPGGEVHEHWEIVAADDAGMTIATKIYTPEGTLLKDEGAATSTWAELALHAVFPAAQTAREEVVYESAFGTLPCWKYTVVDPTADTVKRLYFAKTMPGPPVFMSVVEGKGTVMEFTMLSRAPLPPGR